jgi:hypothetical protein
MVFQSVRVTDDGDDCRVMQNAVQNRVGQLRVLKDFVPGLEVNVRCKDRASLFIPHIDQLKEKLGILRINGKVTNFINNKQLVLLVMLQSGFKPVFDPCALQLLKQVMALNKIGAGALFRCRDANRCVFPTPLVPRKTIFSLFSRNRRDRKSIICCLLTAG